MKKEQFRSQKFTLRTRYLLNDRMIKIIITFFAIAAQKITRVFLNYLLTRPLAWPSYTALYFFA